jgi:hypothetical protein
LRITDIKYRKTLVWRDRQSEAEARAISEAEARAIRERRRREEEMSEREAMRLAERHRKKRSRPPLGCRTRSLLRN